MSNTETQLKRARALITDKKYREARRILRRVDHPTARRWLVRLDEIAPEPGRRGSRRGLWGALVLFLTAGACCVAALGIPPEANTPPTGDAVAAVAATGAALPTVTVDGVATADAAADYLEGALAAIAPGVQIDFVDVRAGALQVGYRWQGGDMAHDIGTILGAAGGTLEETGYPAEVIFIAVAEADGAIVGTVEVPAARVLAYIRDEIDAAALMAGIDFSAFDER